MNDDNDDNGDDGDDNDDEGNTYDYIPAWSMENTETIIEKHQRRATLYEGTECASLHAIGIILYNKSAIDSIS